METADYYHRKLSELHPKPPGWEKHPYTVEGPYIRPLVAFRRRVLAFLVRLAFYLAFTAGWVWLLVQVWIDNP